MLPVQSLFTTASDQFKETTEILYGKCEAIRYYHVDLLWGQKLYQPLRFVLMEYNGVQSILVSTRLDLAPLTMIHLYSYRFRIECMFRELKQQLGAFCYHFWTKYMPKLNHYRKKNAPQPLDLVTNPKAIVSESTVMYYLRKHIFRIMAESPELSITQIIRQEQDKSGIYNDLQAS